MKPEQKQKLLALIEKPDEVELYDTENGIWGKVDLDDEWTFLGVVNYHNLFRIKPKFKIGDYVRDKGCLTVYKIESIDDIGMLGLSFSKGSKWYTPGIDERFDQDDYELYSRVIEPEPERKGIEYLIDTIGTDPIVDKINEIIDYLNKGVE
jgi:hypothetical protein